MNPLTVLDTLGHSKRPQIRNQIETFSAHIYTYTPIPVHRATFWIKHQPFVRFTCWGKLCVGKCAQQRVLCLVLICHNIQNNVRRFVRFVSAMHQRQNRNVGCCSCFAFRYCVPSPLRPLRPSHHMNSTLLASQKPACKLVDVIAIAHVFFLVIKQRVFKHITAFPSCLNVLHEIIICMQLILDYDF